MNSGETVKAGSPVFAKMHELSQKAIRLTFRLNTTYHNHEGSEALKPDLTGTPVHESFGMFPPFYTDCVKNIHMGKRVFINPGCKFQDQEGFCISDDVLAGHNCVIATDGWIECFERVRYAGGW